MSYIPLRGAPVWQHGPTYGPIKATIWLNYADTLHSVGLSPSSWAVCSCLHRYHSVLLMNILLTLSCWEGTC